MDVHEIIFVHSYDSSLPNGPTYDINPHDANVVFVYSPDGADTTRSAATVPNALAVLGQNLLLGGVNQTPPAHTPSLSRSLTTGVPLPSDVLCASRRAVQVAECTRLLLS